MSDFPAYWLNIFIPTKKVTIHSAHCRYVHDKQPSLSHPSGELGPDGGWLDCLNLQDAEALASDFAADGFVVKRCQYCL